MSPAQTSFINRWFPPTEVARIVAFTITGKALAGTVGFPVSSRLCQMQNFGGWKAMFYLFGKLNFSHYLLNLWFQSFFLAIFGMIWVLAWALYASNSPAHHRCISKKEKKFIREELKQLEMNHDPKTTKVCRYFRFESSDWGPDFFPNPIPTKYGIGPRRPKKAGPLF